jgi:hypothetical protein
MDVYVNAGSCYYCYHTLWITSIDRVTPSPITHIDPTSLFVIGVGRREAPLDVCDTANAVTYYRLYTLDRTALCSLALRSSQHRARPFRLTQRRAQ